MASVDKRRAENIRVKRGITDTLFKIMQTKSLSEISVSELVRGAGVARASFYRNYSSKEDVLLTLIRDVLEQFRGEMAEGPEGVFSRENVLLCFRYFERYRDYVLDLYGSGFGLALLEEINLFHESVEGAMPFSSVEKYALYAYTGALFNTAVTWLRDGRPVPVEEIAGHYFENVAGLR